MSLLVAVATGHRGGIAWLLTLCCFVALLSAISVKFLLAGVDGVNRECNLPACKTAAASRWTVSREMSNLTALATLNTCSRTRLSALRRAMARAATIAASKLCNNVSDAHASFTWTAWTYLVDTRLRTVSKVVRSASTVEAVAGLLCFLRGRQSAGLEGVSLFAAADTDWN